MIALLAPLGLGALAALALPLLIHLLRRPEERVVPFAAWHYLSEPARPRERLRLRHWLLLALRLLLIALIAILLSQPVWRGTPQRAMAVTALWPGVDPQEVVITADPAVRRLDSGAPASALRQIDAELPAGAALTVKVPAVIPHLDAERLRLSREVQWQIVPAAVALPSAAPASTTAITVAIRTDDDAQSAAEVRTAQALLNAWQMQGLIFEIDRANQDVPLKLQTGLLFWFGAAPTAAVERWIARGGHALLSRQHNAPFASTFWTSREQGLGRSLQLAGALDAMEVPALRDAQLPAQWGALLLPQPVIDRARAQSVAPLAGAPSGGPQGHSLDAELALLAALLFALERLLAARLQRA